MPPMGANTLHKHIRSEEFYFVLEGTGRTRVGEQTLTVPRYGGVLVGPDPFRQVFNDTGSEALWRIPRKCPPNWPAGHRRPRKAPEACRGTRRSLPIAERTRRPGEW